MKKNRYNLILKEFASQNLSPTKEEQDKVSSIYNAIKECLGDCFISGSYSRFTSIRPLHDLDIIFIAGNVREDVLPDPHELLDSLHYLIQNTFINPIKCNFSISKQSHSITLDFDDLFAIDVVPCYKLEERNEYGDNLFLAPEILKVGRSKRNSLYNDYIKADKQIGWIKTDPKGYIKEAVDINETNDQFRKSVKLAKSWKNSCKRLDERFKLKSFHIEQAIVRLFTENPNIELYDALFKFFVELPSLVSHSQIPDRANKIIFIDDYIDNITDQERNVILLARDQFLYELEHMANNDTLYSLFSPKKLESKRFDKEEFLFDLGIPELSDPSFIFNIDGTVLHKKTGTFQLHAYDLSQRGGSVKVERKIDFYIKKNNTLCDYTLWKVKNSNDCEQPRGEITENKTLKSPEETKFEGEHYVQCFAIKNGVCVAKSKIDVIIS